MSQSLRGGHSVGIWAVRSGETDRPRGRRAVRWPWLLALLFGLPLPATSQRVAAQESGGAGGETGYRRLAPGVLTEIPAHKSVDESVQRMDLPAIAGVKVRDWRPADAPATSTLKALSSNRASSRGIWCLDFAFLPPRLIDVEVPDLSVGLDPARRAGEAGNGPVELRSRRTRLWYLVYRVRNVPGQRVRIEALEGDQGPPVEAVEEPVVFRPLFIFETREPLDESEGLAAYRAYADQVVPGAAEAIRGREGPGPKLYDSASIAGEPLAVGEERWGVATWEGVDPRIDFFSILIRGLTNRLEYRSGLPGDVPDTALECLELDFRRRGDAEDLDDQEVMVGYQGLFERVALGTVLIDAANRVRNTRARPTEALQGLGLTWKDLLPPARSEAESLEPGPQPERGVLARVVARIAAKPDLGARVGAARDLLGDGGPPLLEAVAGAALRGIASSGPAEPGDGESGDREPGAGESGAGESGGTGLEGLDPGRVAADPLTGLAEVLAALDAIEPTERRLAVERRLFGQDAARVRMLESAVLAARTVAVLESLGIVLAPFSTLAPRAAFEEISRLLEKEPGDIEKDDTVRRGAVIRGLFGPEGDWLYQDAIRRHEGIDHRWVFRYESE
jgi:hypothetical protein